MRFASAVAASVGTVVAVRGTFAAEQLSAAHVVVAGLDEVAGWL